MILACGLVVAALLGAGLLALAIPPEATAQTPPAGGRS